MGKDKLDIHTRDMIGGKVGRPVVNPDLGPMTEKERQERCRAGRKAVQILLDERDKDKLMKYCKRYDISRHDLITNVIKALRLTDPHFLG